MSLNGVGNTKAFGGYLMSLDVSQSDASPRQCTKITLVRHLPLHIEIARLSIHLISIDLYRLVIDLYYYRLQI